MVVRALHFEAAELLEAAQFKLAFARFVARWGRPSYVNSDNGTNLKAGEKELREELARLTEQLGELRALYPEMESAEHEKSAHQDHGAAARLSVSYGIQHCVGVGGSGGQRAASLRPLC